MKETIEIKRPTSYPECDTCVGASKVIKKTVDLVTSELIFSATIDINCNEARVIENTLNIVGSAKSDKGTLMYGPSEIIICPGMHNVHPEDTPEGKTPPTQKSRIWAK